MGLLKHFRSRSRLREREPQAATYEHPALPSNGITTGDGRGSKPAPYLPQKVLQRIFAYVCPHSQDQSYESSESSQVGDGCMLCDLRDLASCARVCRAWCGPAQAMLYQSVRIDAVHYCELEDILAERRRKQHRHLRKGSRIEPGEVPNIRLGLLSRTVNENQALADKVLFLKLSYMARETAKGDLARTISMLRNLRYVDLPDGFFTADASTLPLRQELQARCPQLRKMVYRAGAEDELSRHPQGYWRNLELLELDSLAVEPSTIRMVLGSLPQIRELVLSRLDLIDNTIFQSHPGQLPEFPSLQTLTVTDIPTLTSLGLQTWLETPRVRQKLESLTLTNTGVSATDLHKILWAASSLRHLSISETVTKSFGFNQQQIQPLASPSLRVLHFEIVSSEDVHTIQKPAESYYAYLASSLHQNTLPALETLYVRDTNFAELLLTPPLPPTVSSDGAARQEVAGFDQTLEVFSKGIDELEWVFTSITPPSRTRDNRASISGGRPLSAYIASRGLGPQWAQGGFGGEARKSVVVGNGFGGFLAVPVEEVPRPTSSGGSPIHGGGRFGDTLGPEVAANQSPGHGTAGRFGGLQNPPSMGKLTGHGHNRASRHDLWR